MESVAKISELEKEFLRVPDIARKLNVTPQAVYNWIWQGLIPAYKISHTYLIPKDEFLEFLEKRRYSPSKQ